MSTVDRLLDAAENRMRSGGFHAVSFRDLADDLSIKSASVHYYYRHKEDLGAAVVERYRTRFLERLNAAISENARSKERVVVMCDAFRDALHTSDQVCLCGIIGAEAQGLPQAVRQEVRTFLTDCTNWLEAGYLKDGIEDGRRKALTCLASLEGAMILAVNHDDHLIFDAIASETIDRA